MEHDYIIDIQSISSIENTYTSACEKMNNGISAFGSSYFCNSSNDTINRIASTINSEASRLADINTRLSVRWKDYVESVNENENSLSRDCDALEVCDGISEIVDSMIIPVLTGEKVSNSSLGFKKNAQAFRDYIKYNDHTGQCVTLFEDYLDWLGIGSTLRSKGLHVNWAEEYYTNKNNRELLKDYFEVVPVTDKSELKDGDCLVFTKGSNYSEYSHVGFYDATTGKLMGRNQENSNLTVGVGNVTTYNNANLNDLGTNVFVYRLKDSIDR